MEVEEYVERLTWLAQETIILSMSSNMTIAKINDDVELKCGEILKNMGKV